MLSPNSPEILLLTAIPRGEAPASWPALVDPAFSERFLAAAARHGIQPLVYYLLSPTPAWNHWPPEVRHTLQRQAWKESAWETLTREEVAKVLEALTARGIQPLLMKGAALAYSHYPEPFLRPRGDTDLLIRPEDKDATWRVLDNLGYTSPPAVSGDWVSYQRMFGKTLSPQSAHTLDVHWRINNGELFARSLTYRELLDGSVPTPAFGPQARALGADHALLLACMHRVNHFTEGHDERLLWLYDIHLLIAHMPPERRQAFARMAVAKGMAAICLDGLRTAQDCFATPVADELTEVLMAPGAAEPSAALLTAGPLGSLWSDFRALAGWRDQLAFLKELCFPPADYMLAKYGVRDRHRLPLLYLKRGAEGGWKRLRR